MIYGNFGRFLRGGSHIPLGAIKVVGIATVVFSGFSGPAVFSKDCGAASKFFNRSTRILFFFSDCEVIGAITFPAY